MLIGASGGSRLANKGATGGAARAAFGGGGRSGRLSGHARRALASGETAGRPRSGYPGYYGPLVLGGLALCAAAVVLVLVVRRGRRGDTGPEGEDAAPPAPPSGGSGLEPAETPEPPEGPGTQADAPEPSPDGRIEERVRARIGEDPRTRDLPPVSIRVEDGMAWIDGSAPSQEAKEALTEVVGAVDGLNIVVNRVAVGGA